MLEVVKHSPIFQGSTIGMQPMMMTVFGVSFIFVMTLAGAMVVFCFKKGISHKQEAVFFGFAAGIMTAASIWSLLLPAISQADDDWGDFAFMPAVIGFCVGGAFLGMLDGILKGELVRKKKGNAKMDAAKSLKLFFAVTLHNIPEGLAVGFAFGSACVIGTTSAYLTALGLAVGIGLQNFPEGAAVALPMQSTLQSRAKAFWLGTFSGLFEPVFAVVGYFMASWLRILQPWLLAFSAGSMLFVVAEDLLPNIEGEDCRRIATWGFMVGE